MTGTFLAAALGVALAAAPATIPRASIEMLAEVDYEPATPYFDMHASLAFVPQGAFLATPGGLYRFPSRVDDGPAHLAAFGGISVTRVYGHAGRLYLLKPSKETTTGTPTDHALLRSDDGAVTFTPIDQPLGYCSGGFCQFLSGTELIVSGERLYYAAGGNVVASGDGGATWTALVGFLQPSFCYDPSIALVGDRMIIGGECPLDVAYVRAGRLAADGLSWSEEPAPVVTPYLENRNVQFIHRYGASPTVFAGIEGALLRSFDGGASFEFVFRAPLEGAEKYPYVGAIWMPESKPGTVLVGGFDKKIDEGGAWIALTRDYGRTWTDLSDSIPRDASFRPDSVSFLEVDPFGRVLAGVVDVGSSKVRVFEVTLDDTRKRPIRR